MKIFPKFLLVLTALFSWYQMGAADRLHNWIDSNGVTHISKEPPPEDGKLIEIMEYSVRTDEQAKAVQVESEIEPEKHEGNLISEKMQKAEKQPNPKNDLAKACYLHAIIDDFYVYVIEYADADNMLERVLFQGNIPKGHKHLIRSSRGKIEFNYQGSFDDRSYGDNRVDCVNGNVISIP